MNRQQRRAAERNLHRKTSLPVHLLNKQRAKPSDYAERQYLYARVIVNMIYFSYKAASRRQYRQYGKAS